MPISKDNSFYGYVVEWEGLPLSTFGHETYPVEPGTIVVEGFHDRGATLIKIYAGSMEGPPPATGDTVIFGNSGSGTGPYAYLVADFVGQNLYIVDGLKHSLEDRSIGIVVKSEQPVILIPTLFDASPIVGTTARLTTSCPAGTTVLPYTGLTGPDFSTEQKLVLLQDPTQHNILEVTPTTIEIQGGLIDDYDANSPLTQTREQWITMNIVPPDVPDISIGDHIKIVHYGYEIIDFWGPIGYWYIKIHDPGLVEFAPAGTICKVIKA